MRLLEKKIARLHQKEGCSLAILRGDIYAMNHEWGTRKEK